MKIESFVIGGIILLIGISLGYFLYRRKLAMKIMENGIRVKAIMIECREKPANSKDKLAGRIYLPTITFFTMEGKPIVGTPMIGFKSFKEVVAPMEVQVIYDPKDPTKFCVEIPV